MPPPTGSAALTTDLDLMIAIAGKTDARNDELRAMLSTFISAMSSVPASVWGGVAAVRFREVVERWNGESVRLHAALSRIAETIRDNERVLRAVGETHSQHIDSVAAGL
ncbi:WXG100 family type VII secretion target [Mycolicibacterium vaccae]|uniref:WXG100 family type VII secretion target n=1 Tax=Mycolicibacterium vaccae TaxID=1810 RepID=UPI003CE9A2B1